MAKQHLTEQSKGDFQPWNHEEFMADRKVRRMNGCARKTYMSLLHEAFFCSTRPYLPEDDEELQLLADCDTSEEWASVRDAVLGMFERIDVDGEKLYRSKRVEEDWNRLVASRGLRSERARKGAEASNRRRERSISALMPSTSEAEASTEPLVVAKESKEKEKLKEIESKELAVFDGQENDSMKATKQIPILCQTILGVPGRLYPEHTALIQALEAEHKGSAVINVFTEWAIEHKHDEIRNPVAAFLKEADDLLSGGSSFKSTKTPEITNLARELTYISGGVVQFTDKHKARLVAQVEDGFTPAEITAAFREVFEAADKDAAKYIAKNFVETVDQIVYASRKRKLDEKIKSDFMSQESARLERESAEERERRRNLPENQIEQTLGI